MTRKISSLNIVPLIDILLVLFVVLMVIGRFEDDNLFDHDVVINELASSLSQKDIKLEELYKKIQTLKSTIVKEPKKVKEQKELIKIDKTAEYKQEVQKLKKEIEKLKRENNSINILCESIDTYVVNGKRMSLNDVLFLNSVFGGFGKIEYQWYGDNQESLEARDIFVRRAKIKPIKGG